jgi:dihydroorotase
MNSNQKTQPKKLTLPLWADLHAHFRQGAITKLLAEEYLKMGCYAVLAMPNTKPPVGKVLNDGIGAELDCWSVIDYQKTIAEAFSNKLLGVIVPLYITKNTTPEMIAEGAKKGVLKAVKYYPPHGTTNSDHGVGIAELINSNVMKALEENGVILCIHGEEHNLTAHKYFDKHTNAEVVFYQNFMPQIVKKYPKLRIVAEHITTKEAVDFVAGAGDNVVATITPQHLLYTIGDLLQTKSTHLVCMPYVKFDEDRNALLQAVINPNNSKFFAGTDNAPHPKLSKHTDCGCAAGCYVGGIAPQLYAMAFEQAGADLGTPQGFVAFKKFLCDIGPEFYNLPKPNGSFELINEPAKVEILQTELGEIIPLPVGMVADSLRAEVTLPWRVGGVVRG